MRPQAVGRNSILPRWIGQDRVGDPRSLSRSLVEVALRALADQRLILPVVAGMTKCGDQIVVPGEGLREDAVPEFAAADAVTEQNQRLDLIDGFTADGDVARTVPWRWLAVRPSSGSTGRP